MIGRALPLFLLLPLLPHDEEPGFKHIFNEKDLSGWKFHLGEEKADATKTFSVKDGAIVCTGKPAGYMYTDASYKEFTLRFDWRYARPADLKDDASFPGNSGYILFIQKHEVWPKGIEVQGMNRDAGSIIPIKCEAKYDSKKEAIANARKPVGEWNAMEIAVKGGKIEVRLNGTLISTVTSWEPKEGSIGFQSEGAEIHWRHLRIKTE